MDALASDCAEFAAGYPVGGHSVNELRNAIETDLEGILRTAEDNIGARARGHIEVKLEFVENEGIKIGIRGKKAESGEKAQSIGSVAVRLRIETKDFFRLPFLSATCVEGWGVRDVEPVFDTEEAAFSAASSAV